MIAWTRDRGMAEARARQSGRFVLIYARLDWSPGVRAWEQGLLVDPRFGDLMREFFEGVLIEGKGQGGEELRPREWPTLFVGDAEGHVLGRLPWAPSEVILERLRRVGGASAEAARAILLEPLPPRPAREKELPLSVSDEALELLLSQADPVHGGWGRNQKFPHPDALQFLTVRWGRTREVRARSLVDRTLRSMRSGAIFDAERGAFHRFAGQPDWSHPGGGMLLDVNASRALAYLEAGQAFGDRSFSETASRILEWIEANLRSSELPLWFAGTLEEDPKAIDSAIFTDRNARAAQAFLRAGLQFDDDGLRRRGLEVLHFLIESLQTPRLGLHHEWKEGPHGPGHLSDFAALLRALVEAIHSARGANLLRPALDLARRGLEEFRLPSGRLALRSSESGPREEDGNSQQSIQIGAAFAESCVRLGHLARSRDLVHEGRRLLFAWGSCWRRHGQWAATLARAVDLVHEHPVHVSIIGPTEDRAVRALVRAAHEPYLPARLVQVLDASVDPDLLRAAALDPLSPGTVRALVHRGMTAYGVCASAQELTALLASMARKAASA